MVGLRGRGILVRSQDADRTVDLEDRQADVGGIVDAVLAKRPEQVGPGDPLRREVPLEHVAVPGFDAFSSIDTPRRTRDRSRRTRGRTPEVQNTPFTRTWSRGREAKRLLAEP